LLKSSLLHPSPWQIKAEVANWSKRSTTDSVLVFITNLRTLHSVTFGVPFRTGDVTYVSVYLGKLLLVRSFKCSRENTDMKPTHENLILWSFQPKSPYKFSVRNFFFFFVWNLHAVRIFVVQHYWAAYLQSDFCSLSAVQGHRRSVKVRNV
jgi:hypothetical protein